METEKSTTLFRIPGCTQMLWGHSSDVSSVAFHPSGLTFATCSEDKTVTSDQDISSMSFDTAIITFGYSFHKSYAGSFLPFTEGLFSYIQFFIEL